MPTTIKNFVEFKYRKDTLPTNPMPGTFYWIETGDGDLKKTHLYFTTSDNQLIRIDNHNFQRLVEDDPYIDLVTDETDSDIQKISLKYGTFPEVQKDENGQLILSPISDSDEGLVKLSSVVNYFGNVVNDVIGSFNDSQFYECGVNYGKTDKIGDIDSGLSKSDFTGDNKQTINQIIDKILFPTYQPEFVEEPGVKLSFSHSEFVDELLVKSKTPISNYSINNLSINVNKGKLSYENNHANYDYYGNEDKTQRELIVTPTFQYPVTEEKIYEMQVKCKFEDGGKPLDNKSYYATSIEQFNSSYIYSNTIKLISVYPIYVNTEDITQLTEQPLINYLDVDGGTFEATIPPENDNKNEKFKIRLPNGVKLLSVKQYNVTTGKFDINIEMSNNAIESKRIDNVYYITYTRTLNQYDTKVTPVRYQITIKKTY